MIILGQPKSHYLQRMLASLSSIQCNPHTPEESCVLAFCHSIFNLLRLLLRYCTENHSIPVIGAYHSFLNLTLSLFFPSDVWWKRIKSPSLVIIATRTLALSSAKLSIFTEGLYSLLLSALPLSLFLLPLWLNSHPRFWAESTP